MKIQQLHTRGPVLKPGSYQINKELMHLLFINLQSMSSDSCRGYLGFARFLFLVRFLLQNSGCPVAHANTLQIIIGRIFSSARTVPERTLFWCQAICSSGICRHTLFLPFYLLCFCSTFVVFGCLVTKTPAVTATPITASIMTAIPIFLHSLPHFLSSLLLNFPLQNIHTKLILGKFFACFPCFCAIQFEVICRCDITIQFRYHTPSPCINFLLPWTFFLTNFFKRNLLTVLIKQCNLAVHASALLCKHNNLIRETNKLFTAK